MRASKMSYEDKHSESGESLLSEHEPVDFVQRAQRRRVRGMCCAWTMVNVLILLSSVAVLAYTVYRQPSEHEMLRKTSFYSPVWNKLSMTTHPQEVDGSLFESPHASRWRNGVKPSDAVNKAWAEFEPIRTFPISADDVRAIGKDPVTAVKFPESYGLGEDAYVAQLDVFHQLHCLNLLRNIAWAEFERDPAHGKRPYSDLHWIHVSHCTDILLQNLMCAGSMDLVTFNWKETQDLPFADFNVNHQCRDFDAIWKWQDENALPVEVARNFTRPDGAQEVPISKEYFRLFGYEVPQDLHAGEAHDHQFKDPQ